MDTLVHALLSRNRVNSGNKGGLAAITTRKPTLLFRFSVLFLLRTEERNQSVVLFQEPPRRTRCLLALSPPKYRSIKNTLTQTQCISLFRMTNPALHAWVKVTPLHPPFFIRIGKAT